MELQLSIAPEIESVSTITESINDSDYIHLTLKNALLTYLEQHPQLSLHSVSLRSGVSFTTLSRMVKATNIQTISPHNVLNLSAFLWKEYRLEHLVDVVPRTISRFLFEHFGKFMMLKH